MTIPTASSKEAEELYATYLKEREKEIADEQR
jgi:hypothetical protein